MTSPYREAPQFLLCPRCGEMLDVVFSGVAACPRCQGTWVAQPTLDSAFGDPRWPKGRNMWWHDELECPECLLTGTVTKMSARGSGEVRVDACPSHGLWLDRGELSRLLGLEAGTDDLLELQFRVTPSEADVEDLEERRRAWLTEREARRKAAAALRAELAEVHKRRAAEEAEAERQRRADDKSEREREAEEARAAALVKAANELAAANAKASSVAHDEVLHDALMRSYREERFSLRRRLPEVRADMNAAHADLNVMEVELSAKQAEVAAQKAKVSELGDQLERLDARLRILDTHLEANRT